MVFGYFSLDVNKSYLYAYVFNMDYVKTYSITLGSTTIDLTFIKNIETNYLPYVAYFSYHSPLITKIVKKKINGINVKNKFK